MAQVYRFNSLTAKTEITNTIEELNKQEFENEQSRVEEADAVIEAYVEATGERPDGMALNNLGTFILKDYYDSGDRNKKEQENPILSEHQYVRRIKKEKSDLHAQTYGVDGKDYKGAVRTHKKY